MKSPDRLSVGELESECRLIISRPVDAIGFSRFTSCMTWLCPGSTYEIYGFRLRQASFTSPDSTIYLFTSRSMNGQERTFKINVSTKDRNRYAFIDQIPSFQVKAGGFTRNESIDYLSETELQSFLIGIYNDYTRSIISSPEKNKS